MLVTVFKPCHVRLERGKVEDPAGDYEVLS